MKTVLSVLWTCLFLETVTVTSQSLPYNPTTILLPPTTSNIRDIAYAFLPTNSDTTQFVSLNISSTISLSNLTLEIVSADLPFLSNKSNAFTPTISSRGEISVYTGSCATSISAALWRFAPSTTSTIGDGTWEEETANTGSEVTAAALPGANFLSQAFSFATLVDGDASQTKIYVFGGMCPTGAATASTWQSAASYSNHMLRLAPSTTTTTTTTTTSEQTAYTLELPGRRGPPVAEAGFSITGLTPKCSNGSGIETQQQSFVLVGGHTPTAFINMSQVAIWGLPEESWSFVGVDRPAPPDGNSELAVRGPVTVGQVESRSGHTAVLTEDGTRMVILGGWVGDVSQAAEPQLAVLHLGQGFGGSGDWQWTVPDEQPSGSGMYGHGAVLLPGNVMMVLGGYEISSTSTSTSTSASASATAVPARFFNATSMTWVTDYTNPAYAAAIASSASPSQSTSNSTSTSTSTIVGLSAGVGLGVAAILGALLVYLCYNRRLRRRRKAAREQDLRTLSLVATNYYQSPRREMSQSGGSLWPDQHPHPRGNGGYKSHDQGHETTRAGAGYENLDSGVHGLGARAPNQIPRKALHSRNINARGAYQPAPNIDSGNGNGNGNGNGHGNPHGNPHGLGTAGPIHPIYEADEDDPTHHAVGIAIGDPNFTPGPPARNSYSRYSDPFKDPPPANFAVPVIRLNRSVSSSAAPSPNPSPAESREREIQEWVSDWAAAEALLNSQARSHSNAGRISPTRRAQLIATTATAEEDSVRTASDLSERSERSVNISSMSVSRSGSSSRSQGRSRSDSLRGFVTGINPFPSTVSGSATLSPILDTHTGLPIPSSAGSGSSGSFNTARTSFPALQAEGETLLPRPPTDDLSAGGYSPTRSHADYVQGSPSKSRPFAPAKRRAGWLGSLRRVFVNNNGEEGVATPNPQAPIYRDDSPTRSSLGQPRRTVSAGATLLRRKQGRGDWEDSAGISAASSSNPRSSTLTHDPRPQFQRYYTDAPLAGPGGGASAPARAPDDDDDEDWDVEQAVQNRVVQVMFTVPKERLRVVNVDEDAGSEAASSVAGGSVRSRKGSGGRSLRGLVMPLSRPTSATEEGEVKPLLVDLDLDRGGSPPGDHAGSHLETGREAQGASTAEEVPSDHDAEAEREGKRDKGRAREREGGNLTERERVREMEREMEREVNMEMQRERDGGGDGDGDGQRGGSPTRPGKAKSRVLGLVESIERRGSPGR